MLQVGIARHDRLHMLLGQVQQDLAQMEELASDLLELVLEVEVHVSRHLVITRAGCMEFAGHWTDFFGQQGLHVHMDVFINHIKADLSRLVFLQELGQAGLDGLGFVCVNNPGLSQHLDMGQTALEIIGGQAVVKADTGSKFLYPAFQRSLKTAAP